MPMKKAYCRSRPYPSSDCQRAVSIAKPGHTAVLTSNAFSLAQIVDKALRSRDYSRVEIAVSALKVSPRQDRRTRLTTFGLLFRADIKKKASKYSRTARMRKKSGASQASGTYFSLYQNCPRLVLSGGMFRWSPVYKQAVRVTRHDQMISDVPRRRGGLTQPVAGRFQSAVWLWALASMAL